MGKGMKKLLAVVLVLIIIGGAAYYILKAKGYETGIATLSDVLNSKSERKVANMPTIVSHESPYYALIGTPVALYYEKTTTPPTGFALNVTAPYVNISVTTLIPGSEWMVRYASPLLVVCDKEPSRAVIRFMEQYNNPPVVTIGDVPSTLSSDEREWEAPTSVTLDVTKSFEGSAKGVSLSVAKYFWSHSDGVVLIKNNQDGYNQAVVAVALASYVNIPVIVTDTVDENVAKTLESLGVKYSLVCGDMKGYKLTKHFNSVEEIQDWTISVVRQRLGDNVSYITMANPMDAYRPKVLESKVVLDVSGEIEHSPSTAYPGRPEMGVTESVVFDIPYKYANINVDLVLDISDECATFTPAKYDLSGARMYVFLAVDTNNNDQFDEGEDKVQYFGGSPAYKNVGFTSDPTSSSAHINPPQTTEAVFNTQIPIFNDKGKHVLGLLAKIPSDKDRKPWQTTGWTAPYTLKVTVEKLDSYVYPWMHDASSLAPYLTAYRKGVVLAKPEYMIYSDDYVDIKDSSNPAANLELIEPTNNKVAEVKKDLNNLLGRLAGMPAETDEDIIALAEYYHSMNENKNYTHLAIIADPQMIPHYYYPSKGLGEDSQEGYLVPGDNIYSDIDADLDNPIWGLNERYPRMELADGRISGFDTQDISALLCRTFFYHDIIDKMGVRDARGQLSNSWKENGFGMIGTEPPVGAAATAREKVGDQWARAEFSVDTESRNRQLAGRQDATPLYESSNFIYICSHGFWYWYVPTASKSMVPYYEAGAGGAMDVAHVKLMEFGPSVFWASSCVTSRDDGIEPYNALSNAFLHAGMNCYLGGTRSMWGVIIPNPDARSGEKMGDLMMLYWYAHMCGWLYDKSQGGIIVEEPISDLSTGAALMLAKNTFIAGEGTDGGAENDDTYEEVLLHGDPAFNPYEPNHEGMF